MPLVPFHSRLIKAECEFWFDPGAEWQEHTERRMETALASAFADAPPVSEPFLWFEPNYLAVLSEPLGRAKGHQEVEAHSDRVRRALAVYREAAKPRRVQTVFVHYEFGFQAEAFPMRVRKLVRDTPRERLTLEQQAPAGAAHHRLSVRCLLTQPPAGCLTRFDSWLHGAQCRMDAAFQELRTSDAPAESRR